MSTENPYALLNRFCRPGRATYIEIVFEAWNVARTMKLEANAMLSQAAPFVVREVIFSARELLKKLQPDSDGAVVGNGFSVNYKEYNNFIPRAFIESLAAFECRDK